MLKQGLISFQDLAPPRRTPAICCCPRGRGAERLTACAAPRKSDSHVSTEAALSVLVPASWQAASCLSLSSYKRQRL